MSKHCLETYLLNMEGKPEINDGLDILLDHLISKGIKDGDTQSPPYANICVSYLREGIKLLNLGLQNTDPESRQRLNLISNAQNCFKKSLDVITSAFNNNSVSTTNRFMAWTLHVAATILKSRSVEDPEAAVTVCQSQLEELCNLPAATQEILSVFLKYITFSQEKIVLVYRDSYDSKISNESTNHQTWPRIKKQSYVPSDEIFALEWSNNK